MTGNSRARCPNSSALIIVAGTSSANFLATELFPDPTPPTTPITGIACLDLFACDMMLRLWNSATVFGKASGAASDRWFSPD